MTTDNTAASAPQPLLDCPFCGSEAEVMIESSYYQVGCKNEECYAEGEWNVDRNEAIAWWNRRTETDRAALKAQVEALTKLCATLEAIVAEYYEKENALWREAVESEGPHD